MRFTLWGMMQYNDQLLSGIVLPQGMDALILENLIEVKAGELYPYYQVPDRVQKNTEYWFQRKLPQFQRMYDALMQEYNPLENYNRIEDGNTDPDLIRVETPDITKIETPDITRVEIPDLKKVEEPDITRTENRNSETEGSIKSSKNGSDSIITTTSGKNNNTETRNVSAYDSAAYVPRDQIVNQGSNSGKEDRQGATEETSSDNAAGTATDKATATETGTRTYTETGTRTYTENGTRTDRETGTRTHTEKGTTKTHLHARGNIGVTTSQQMLQEELEIRLYDLYEVIADLWIGDFIVRIY